MIIGRTIISEKAIEQIVLETIYDCYGVAGVHKSTMLDKVRGKPPDIKIKTRRNILTLQLSLLVEPELPFQQVAKNTIHTLKFILSKMVGIEQDNIKIKLYLYKVKS